MILLSVYVASWVGIALPALVPTILVLVRDHYDHRDYFPELK